ncbi:hypothetical protein OESDEN_15685 [Oesophagostomum dentatum]|uniref:Uncharacterized protein n=1 Tax=Oesophagostomum dentatum TaxID=61180 RepID=A0A0B1SI64_OESDE|nr:hypothetical protein OESDEN_15685 [Oesophagostomum dentatum]
MEKNVVYSAFRPEFAAAPGTAQRQLLCPVSRHHVSQGTLVANTDVLGIVLGAHSPRKLVASL